MTYRIARNGQLYGPYSLREAERYLASGHILATDLAQPVGGEEWLPISTLFPTTPIPAPRTLPGGMPRLFPDPPDLPWWVALILDVFTLGLFFVVWDIVLTAWMHRIERSSIAVYLYIAAAVIFVLNLPASWHSIQYSLFDAAPLEPAHPFLFIGGGFLIRLVARFVFRSELLHHFNGPEPIGLRLNAFFTLLFGGLYFQYHFNRINQVKRTLRISVPAA
jgi:hypothetical protein